MGGAPFEFILRWAARDDGPEDLANRFCKTIDELATIFPEYSRWVWADSIELMDSVGEAGQYPLARVRRDMPKAIKRNILVLEGYDEPFSGAGFYLGAMSNSNEPTDSLGYFGMVGSTSQTMRGFANDISFRVGTDLSPAYASFRDTMILLAETWETTYGVLCPPALKANREIGLPMVGWMAYLSPRAARVIQRPSDVLTEERPNSGLFLTATTEVFDMSNPAHVASARRIEHALDVFNDPDFDTSIPYI